MPLEVDADPDVAGVRMRLSGETAGNHNCSSLFYTLPELFGKSGSQRQLHERMSRKLAQHKGCGARWTPQRQAAGELETERSLGLQRSCGGGAASAAYPISTGPERPWQVAPVEENGNR